MEGFNRKLKGKEVSWIKIYFQSGGNASEATRYVYGGTPLSCRVKGHKLHRRLQPVINDIVGRGFDQMKTEDTTGVDFYLEDRDRRLKESEFFGELMRHPKRFLKLSAEAYSLSSS